MFQTTNQLGIWTLCPNKLQRKSPDVRRFLKVLWSSMVFFWMSFFRWPFKQQTEFPCASVDKQITWETRRFPEIRARPIDGIFHYKQTILGYPHFRKPPYEYPWIAKKFGDALPNRWPNVWFWDDALKSVWGQAKSESNFDWRVIVQVKSQVFLRFSEAKIPSWWHEFLQFSLLLAWDTISSHPKSQESSSYCSACDLLLAARAVGSGTRLTLRYLAVRAKVSCKIRRRSFIVSKAWLLVIWRCKMLMILEWRIPWKYGWWLGVP